MDLIVHHNISDLYRSLNLPLEQELDFTIHFLPDLHQKLPFKSPVFRADYFSFVFVKDGKGSYTIDDNTYPFESRTVYFTNPGHIKAFEIIQSRDAYIITLTETFLMENVHPEIFKEFPFLLAETVPPKTLDQEVYSEFELLYTQIFKEFRNPGKYQKKVLGNLFVVLLLKIKAYFWQDYNPIEEGDRNSQIVKSFKRLLEQQFNGLLNTGFEYTHTVQDYANELNLHPNYLNTVIKSKTGKSAHQWIAERLISGAKSLLKNTSLTVKEISIRFGYSEPNHFSRFFKNYSGQTPSTYRKNS
ncbi:AraC family transcriptional regulator [Poritiphilus flavus]|uniref:Helix-turn-helix domain-containing protein n=1 Tax=Poritiphilus flavus TaxID=2697053 RepID=A0A6L9EGS9_9FLAO|nr:helix-turn-helix domain-containing protein [Poritiphilus flavus]NAS13964.1 helix-turn-helix domain-containing protein [Poritiphilus flavus]